MCARSRQARNWASRRRHLSVWHYTQGPSHLRAATDQGGDQWSQSPAAPVLAGPRQAALDPHLPAAPNQPWIPGSALPRGARLESGYNSPRSPGHQTSRRQGVLPPTPPPPPLHDDIMCLGLSRSLKAARGEPGARRADVLARRRGFAHTVPSAESPGGDGAAAQAALPPRPDSQRCPAACMPPPSSCSCA